MEIIVNAISIVIFMILCCHCISQGINKSLQKELNEQKQKIKNWEFLYQNSITEIKILYEILQNIKLQLSLLDLSKCPKEEFENISLIIKWIEEFIKIRGNEENELYK